MAQRKKTMVELAAEYSGIALLLPCSTFVGYLIGHYLDIYFGTTWLTVLFLILGSVGGFVSLIRQIMRDTGDDGAG